jgi:DNA polymerase-3 subunit epsilon
LNPSDTTKYDSVLQQAERALTQDPSVIETALVKRISHFVSNERYEEAATIRDRLNSFSTGVFRASSIRTMGQIPEIIAASPTADGGWDIHVIRHGWLAGSTHAPSGQPPLPFVDSIAQTAATQLDREHLVRETELILRWLTSGQTRIVHITAGHAWSMPIGTRPYSAEMAKRWLTDIKTVSADVAPPLSID